jgi:5S rRNA maturation endonuclease (ribonuclease M5)
MQNDFLSQKLINLLPGNRKRTPNGSVNINCPMCLSRGEARPDTKLRCGIRTDGAGSISINCFNCGYRTRWSPGSLISRNLRDFLSNIGVNDLDIKKLNFTAWQMSQNLEGTPVERESARFIPNFVELELPPDAMPISEWAALDCTDEDFIDVVSYAMSRGDHVFGKHEFYWTPDKGNHMNRRLIIPFYWKDKIVGWTGRAIDDGVLPKYMTNTPGHFLFNNVNMYKDRKYIILVEGQFDSIAIDGVATQGAKISEQQAYWLKDTGKHIIVLPDRDEAGQKLIDLALQHDWMVSFPEWDSDVKDANDAVKKYGKLYTVRSIIDSATDNKLKINLSRKKLSNGQ